MKSKKIILFLVLALTVLAGCFEKKEQKIDCKNPSNKEEMKKCDEAFFKPSVTISPAKTYGSEQ